MPACLALSIALSACGSVASAQSSDSTPIPESAAGSSSAPALALPITGIAQFGADADGNGVPDRLDAFVARMPGGPETKAAATAHFRLTSMLAAKALAGEKLSEAERQQVFYSLSCYSLSAKSEGVKNRYGLDEEFMRNKRAFNGMYALMGALNGTMSGTSLDKEEMCAAAK